MGVNMKEAISCRLFHWTQLSGSRGLGEVRFLDIVDFVIDPIGYFNSEENI